MREREKEGKEKKEKMSEKEREDRDGRGQEGLVGGEHINNFTACMEMDKLTDSGYYKRIDKRKVNKIIKVIRKMNWSSWCFVSPF